MFLQYTSKRVEMDGEGPEEPSPRFLISTPTAAGAGAATGRGRVTGAS